MELVFATHNPNKLKELQAILPEFISVKSLTDIDCTEEIIEDADTIEGNALLKARYVKRNYNYSCFADDTGLEVEALDGAPGVYSARYAGTQKNAEDNMQKLLKALKNKENRKARFKTVIALIIDGKEHVFTGICSGIITTSKQGTSGFGYDPIFIPENYEQSFAQMPTEQKNKISHRAKAVEQLVNFLEKSENQ